MCVPWFCSSVPNLYKKNLGGVLYHHPPSGEKKRTPILMFLSLFLLFIIYYGIHLTQYSHKWWFCSNDDPIFGNVSLGSADEFWSSSKEVTNSPGKSFTTTVDSPSRGIGALRSISEHLEIKREYEQQDNQSFTLSYEKLDGSTSHGLHNVELPGDKSKSIIQEQVWNINMQYDQFFVTYAFNIVNQTKVIM